jgi:2-keto-3-deoxy-L-rhamnonate aldolase RhmA
MNGREIKQALKNGKRIYGTLIVSDSPEWVKVMKNIGMDYVFIDTEHIALDRNILSWMCQSYRAIDLAPIVRIPSPDPYEASKVLDGGASGIVAPYIETVEQVRTLIGAVKFKPLKGKKLERILEGKEEIDSKLKLYIESNNLDNVLIVNIESTPALEVLDDIVKLPGLDGILIGPHDLSTSLGIPEQYYHPEFDRVVKQIMNKARSNNIGVGIHNTGASIEKEIEWIKAGANIVMHKADILTFMDAMSMDLKVIKDAVKDLNHNERKSINI